MFSQLDEACWAPNLYLHWELYKAASARGVRVLLDGLDGDTTVSHGLGYLADLVRMGRWIRFVRESRALSRRNARSYPFGRTVWNTGIRPCLPDAMIRVWRTLRFQPVAQADSSDVLRQAFAERIGCGRKTRSAVSGGAAGVETERQGHVRALSSPLMTSVLEMTDAASSAFGIEARYPFLDQRLIEFCVALPAEQKLQGGWTRAVMRRAMAGVLPNEVQWRLDKADLGCNFRRRLFEGDRAIIEDVVTSGLAPLEEHVDVQAVRAAYRRWSRQPLQQRADALTLFKVVTLAMWLKTSGLGKAVAARRQIEAHGVWQQTEPIVKTDTLFPMDEVT
jgi:asparagine synthase (glutamine-hydrolysing)